MSAIENKRSVVVGIFVFLALVIFVAAIFILGGQQKRFGDSVMVRAIFDDVAGLKPGNNVWFSGVKIGTVKNISFFGAAQVEITMSIEEKSQQYIRQNAIARISSESMIGNKIIVIEGGTLAAPPVEDGDVLVAVNPLDTDDFMATLAKNNENIVEITQDIKVITERLVEGRGTLGAILKDTVMADNFRAVVSNLKRASATTVQVSGELAQFSDRLNTPGSLTNKLLTDKSIFPKIETAVQDLNKTTSAAARMGNNLEAVSAKLNSQNNTLGILLNDSVFANQLQKTMGNLQTSTKKLDENMDAIKANFLLKGYFKRKAVRDAKNEAKQKAKEADKPL